VSADGTAQLHQRGVHHRGGRIIKSDTLCGLGCNPSKQLVVTLEGGKSHQMYEEVDLTGISWHAVCVIQNRHTKGKFVYATAGSAGILVVGAAKCLRTTGPRRLGIDLYSILR
jgi:hypothetical protein